jgi:hypothetical protein
MNAPPGICAACGWAGVLPGFDFADSTNVTFQDCVATCPRCGGTAAIVSGTYDLVGGVVRLVRDADLTLAQVRELGRAAAEARKGGQAANDFVAENPRAAPIVNLIVQQAGGRDWLMILIAVLAIVIPYLQHAQFHADDRQERRSSPPTTVDLSDEDVDTLAEKIGRKIQSTTSEPPPKRTPKPQARPKKRPKTYGKTKRHR